MDEFYQKSMEGVPPNLTDEREKRAAAQEADESAIMWNELIQKNLAAREKIFDAQGKETGYQVRALRDIPNTRYKKGEIIYMQDFGAEDRAIREHQL